MAITNLNEYYASKGQALPSVSQRAGLASQAGISNYTGSPQQNASLLKNLTTNPAPATVVDTTKVATSVNNPAPVIPVGVVTEPQKRMTLPTAPVPTASGALSGNAGVLLQQPVINNLNDLSGANAIAQNNSDIASKTYEEQVLSMLNQVQNRPGELQQQYRIQELQSDQATAKAKYDSLDLAYRRQEEATTTNPSLSAEQKQARLSEIGRKKSSELADVAIDYSLKSGLFTNAKSLMDDQIKAELEPMKLKVDYYKTIKDDYRDVLDKTQKLQIDKVIRDEDRAYQQKKDALELSNSMKLASFKAGLELQQIRERNSSVGLSGDSIPGVDGKKQINNEALDLYTLLGDLKTGKGMKGAVGAKNVFKKLGFATPAVGYSNNVERMKALLSYDNLGKLKGSMSDKDLLFLQQLGSGLNTDLNEKDFTKELNKVSDTLKRNYGYSTEEIKQFTDPEENYVNIVTQQINDPVEDYMSKLSSFTQQGQ